MNFPLFTERLRIQPLGLSDLDEFVRYRQDPEIARFQGWEPTYSAKQGFDLIESQSGVQVPEKGEWLQLAVHESLSGELVGDLAMHSLEEPETAFELGFTIARPYQRRGFAEEATRRLVGHLFEELGAVKLVANSDQRNVASIQLLVKLGFVHLPAKSWVEEFKNEVVTVDHFELRR